MPDRAEELLTVIQFLRETEEQCGRDQRSIIARAIARETLFERRREIEEVLFVLVTDVSLLNAMLTLITEREESISQFVRWAVREAERGVMSEAFRDEAARVRGLL